MHHPAQRILGSPLGPESVAVFGKFVLEYRFDHVAQRHFHHPVFHRRYAQWPQLVASHFWYPDPSRRRGLVFAFLELFLESRQSSVAGFCVSSAAFSIRHLFAFPMGHFLYRTFQIFHLPDFVDQTKPFASFDSSFEGCQHSLGPYAGFRPRPSGRDFSALFSLRHSRQFQVRLYFPHVSTFLPPLAPRSLPASSLLRGL